MEKISIWKEGLESKGLRVNVGKTKVVNITWLLICRSSRANICVGYAERVWAGTRSSAGGVRNGIIRNAVG